MAKNLGISWSCPADNSFSQWAPKGDNYSKGQQSPMGAKKVYNFLYRYLVHTGGGWDIVSQWIPKSPTGRFSSSWVTMCDLDSRLLLAFSVVCSPVIASLITICHQPKSRGRKRSPRGLTCKKVLIQHNSPRTWRGDETGENGWHMWARTLGPPILNMDQFVCIAGSCEEGGYTVGTTSVFLQDPVGSDCLWRLPVR